jgi:8-oxo-dGTP pyrophosphatase MutT (NUDIX family)
MECQLQIHRVAVTDDSHAVIFIHGVNGHWDATWRNPKTRLFWPEEMSRATGYSTFSIQYDANTSWNGTTMPLQERAASILEYLHTEPELANKDLAIVSHSFGGLVAKQMVRHARDNGRYSTLLRRLAAIVFAGTPHGGSALGTYLYRLRWATGATVTAENLRQAEPQLMDLNSWYRNFEDAPRSRVLYETRRTRVGRMRWATVVDRQSSDPGLKGVVVTAVDADHLELSRPSTRDAAQFRATDDFLREVFYVPAALSRLPRQAAAVCYRADAAGLQFLLVKTTGGRWTFPKGGIEKDLSPSQSAAGEAIEEGGVRGIIDPEPLTHYLHAKQEWSRDPRKIQEFCVSAFLLKVTEPNAGEPEEKRDPIWVSPEVAKQRLSERRDSDYELELRRVIDAAVARIGTISP